jgi:hypothetical protein
MNTPHNNLYSGLNFRSKMHTNNPTSKRSKTCSKAVGQIWAKLLLYHLGPLSILLSFQVDNQDLQTHGLSRAKGRDISQRNSSHILQGNE